MAIPFSERPVSTVQRRINWGAVLLVGPLDVGSGLMAAGILNSVAFEGFVRETFANFQ